MHQLSLVFLSENLVNTSDDHDDHNDDDFDDGQLDKGHVICMLEYHTGVHMKTSHSVSSVLSNLKGETFFSSLGWPETGFCQFHDMI